MTQKKRPNYDLLPEHMREGTRGYIENGWPPGVFLRAVLRNDLVGAYEKADFINTSYIREWAFFLATEAPRACWGSEVRLRYWEAYKAYWRRWG